MMGTNILVSCSESLSYLETKMFSDNLQLYLTQENVLLGFTEEDLWVICLIYLIGENGCVWDSGRLQYFPCKYQLLSHTTYTPIVSYRHNTKGLDTVKSLPYRSFLFKVPALIPRSPLPLPYKKKLKLLTFSKTLFLIEIMHTIFHKKL